MPYSMKVNDLCRRALNQCFSPFIVRFVFQKSMAILLLEFHDGIDDFIVIVGKGKIHVFI